MPPDIPRDDGRPDVEVNGRDKLVDQHTGRLKLKMNKGSLREYHVEKNPNTQLLKGLPRCMTLLSPDEGNLGHAKACTVKVEEQDHQRLLAYVGRR